MPDSPGGQRPDPAGDPPPAAREAIYRGLFEHSLSEVHVWQVVRNEAGAIVTWRLVDANPVALGLWGRERHEVIGRTADEIFCMLIAASLIASFSSAFAKS